MIALGSIFTQAGNAILHLLAAQGIAVYAAVVGTASLAHSVWVSRIDRLPQLLILEEPNEDGTYFWHIANTGRVPVILDGCGILIWSGRGLAALFGRFRSLTIWPDSVREVALPQPLQPRLPMKGSEGCEWCCRPTGHRQHDHCDPDALSAPMRFIGPCRGSRH